MEQFFATKEDGNYPLKRIKNVAPNVIPAHIF